MYWFVIVSLIATIGIQVFIGFNGLVWYVFIPVWALANFGLRILKRYFRNIIDDVEAEMFSDKDDENDLFSAQTTGSRNMGFKTFPLVFLVMLFVSALWYCVGMVLGRMF